ncbi:hypothetical protein [Glutamicibacter sp.]|uniref:hypothetical protein n=1 Tax=Glutamicibacter sp. TaxID=1931995 RepID=UPI003D6B8F7F
MSDFLGRKGLTENFHRGELLEKICESAHKMFGRVAFIVSGIQEIPVVFFFAAF